MAYPGVYGTTRVNGGIVNQQTLTGGLRFFKIVGPFEWAISDGGVNLPVVTQGGGTFPPAQKTYFQVAAGAPVPGSAAEIVLQTIIQQSDIVVIGFVPGIEGVETEMDIAVSASAFGWGSDYPNYSTPPANQDEDQLPTTPTHAATEMQTVIQALPNATVYVSTSIDVTGASGTGSIATLTFVAIPVAIPVGSFINVTGVNPSGYNGYYKVTGSTTTSVSYTSTESAAWISGGLITSNALAPETNSVSFGTVSVTEVSFSLGSTTYFTLA
jgi:hypothetical protein